MSPQGFADGMDDDAGTMSAWYVWAMLGLYPITPGDPRYVVTTPMGRNIRINGTALADLPVRSMQQETGQ